jgi:hypothetical protein
MNANDVARQWMRLIIPIMMLVASVGILVVAWIIDRITRKKKKGWESFC